jgi:hypothetical protein
VKYAPMWAQARALPPLPDDADECDICGEPCEGRFCSRECERIAYPEDNDDHDRRYEAWRDERDGRMP